MQNNGAPVFLFRTDPFDPESRYSPEVRHRRAIANAKFWEELHRGKVNPLLKPADQSIDQTPNQRSGG